ncbi:hypothetical protein, partial [Stenotrophomonas maltophilia]|uniref:hypothetical protein n=1 Tax=Stenotrophomonas maltophilia TaxID=40324 RepID=UPI00195311A5
LAESLARIAALERGREHGGARRAKRTGEQERKESVGPARHRTRVAAALQPVNAPSRRAECWQETGRRRIARRRPVSSCDALQPWRALKRFWV